MQTTAAITTTLFGLFLVAWLVVTLADREFAARFLSSFASSAKAHVLEQLLRIVVGLGLLAYADRMLFAPYFKIFGWVLVATSVVLLLLPWRWHHRFAGMVIPFVIKHMVLYGVSAAILGLGILYCVIAPLV